MTWSLETSNGNESDKIKWEILPYVSGNGVDLGCGPWKVYPHALGIDAHLYPSAGNLVCDVTSVPVFASGSFDWVYSSHALEDQVDTVATLREWWRLVKPGGFLILYLPHRDFYPNVGQPGANPAHKHDFIPSDITQAMRELGGDWDLIECQERNGGNEYSFLQVFQKLEDGRGFRESWDEPKPAKRAAVVRLGAYGDAIWASSICKQLKDDGYHVTVYTQAPGAEVLMSDPHVDRIILQQQYLTPSANDLIAYWLHESFKYEKWVNLTGSVEGRLLPAPHDLAFYWSEEQRRARMNENYLEAVHAFADLPYQPAPKFYPTADELAWAKSERAKYDGDVVVVQPKGSTWPKWWPHTERFAALMAERGVHAVVLGDYRGDAPTLPAKYGHFIGMGWTIRQAMTFATLADVVVGEESALVNAAAFEAPLKIVLLSHSTPQNLTRDWPNTVSVEPQGLPCYPCHRLHGGPHFCAHHVETDSAGCQVIAVPEKIAEVIDDYRAWQWKKAAA